jgi:hypothetical protein
MDASALTTPPPLRYAALPARVRAPPAAHPTAGQEQQRCRSKRSAKQSNARPLIGIRRSATHRTS